eukprot:GHRR01036904.1.p1 GENE.GHRR01036904.1~~GHRR01036904.1.p1  ORF type:complete len:232 (+),score=59.97 GHRR01036904.1:405-1100(+)
MVVVDRYKRMGEYKQNIDRLMSLHVAFLMIKVAWHYLGNQLGGLELPQIVLGMVAGEVVVQIAYNLAKLGTSKESLRLLKIFNTIQALVAAAQVLSSWQYHFGTKTDGIPTYRYSKPMLAYILSKKPDYSVDTVFANLKAFEMFLDITLLLCLVLATIVSHKMILEKMEMKRDKHNVKADRKDAQKGGSDNESDGDDDDKGAPAAASLQEDKPKVAKASSTKAQASRRRLA